MRRAISCSDSIASSKYFGRAAQAGQAYSRTDRKMLKDLKFCVFWRSCYDWRIGIKMTLSYLVRFPGPDTVFIKVGVRRKTYSRNVKYIWIISRLQWYSDPWPLRYRCNARPTELWNHTLGTRSICWVHIFIFNKYSTVALTLSRPRGSPLTSKIVWR